MSATVAEIAAYVEGELIGDGTRAIAGLSTPEDASADDLVFVAAAKHLAAAAAAGAVLVPTDLDVPATMTAIRVPSPAAAMARVVDWFFPPRRTFEGVSAQAFVDPTASLGDEVGIAPLAFVGARARIGDRTEVHPSATIGHDARIGRDCVIHSGVHVYPDTVIGERVILHCGVVIGADGFGYVRRPLPADLASPDEPVRYRKIRHVGRVVIEDDVEVGANTAIDRGTLSVTRIGRGTKIDNLVTVGHNASIGRHCIIIGQAGLSGSTVLDDYVTLAGQVGVADHVHIGARAVVGAQSGVTKDIAPDSVVLGSPAVEGMRAKKALTLIDSLPEFKRALSAQARRLAEIERALAGRDDS
jgi:UDP-3-O-[3-hydroxymyristoyl] glucosamine N-acyltransferase